MIEPTETLRQLQELCGYTQNSSERVVVISQDDATRTYHLRVQGYGMGADASAKRYYADSLVGVIAAAYAIEGDAS